MSAAAAAVKEARVVKRSVGADAFSNLKAACVAFVLRNYSKVVEGDEDWLTLPESLRLEIETAFAKAEHAYAFDARGPGGAAGGTGQKK